MPPVLGSQVLMEDVTGASVQDLHPPAPTIWLSNCGMHRAGGLWRFGLRWPLLSRVPSSCRGGRPSGPFPFLASGRLHFEIEIELVDRSLSSMT